MKKFTIILTVLIAIAIRTNSAFAQCTNQVTHLTGTAMVNGVNVSVSSSGMNSSNSTYCASTVPYFVGYSGTASGNGMFTFDFSPPVDFLTLNFSGISNGGIGQEIIVLSINGSHYSIPSAGTANGCDQIAALTPSGNITGCSSCSASGWNGTTISGNITSLTVLDSTAWGQANGALFSLFICDGISTGIEQIEMKPTFQLFPNLFSSETTVQANVNLDKATLLIYNLAGQQIKEIKNISGHTFTLFRDNLQAGLYFLCLIDNNKVIMTNKMIICE